MGLDKYIPEFTVNQINGTKFLDLDGNKLKVIHDFVETIRFFQLKKGYIRSGSTTHRFYHEIYQDLNLFHILFVLLNFI